MPQDDWGEGSKGSKDDLGRVLEQRSSYRDRRRRKDDPKTPWSKALPLSDTRNSPNNNMKEFKDTTPVEGVMVLSMETPLVEGEENNRVLVLRMVPSSRDTLTIMKTFNTTHKQTSIASYLVSAGEGSPECGTAQSSIT